MTAAEAIAALDGLPEHSELVVTVPIEKDRHKRAVEYSISDGHRYYLEANLKDAVREAVFANTDTPAPVQKACEFIDGIQEGPSYVNAKDQ